MAQVPHVDVSSTPTDITVGLEDGCYIGQCVGGPLNSIGISYATADVAPDAADYFTCFGGYFFSFTVGDDEPPTWVVGPPSYRVAIAKV